MIACVSPGHSSADHTLNTLKYADRLKDRSENQKQMAKYEVPEELLNNHQEVSKPVEKKMPSSQENKEPNSRKDSEKAFKPVVNAK